jgi:hypothetical protein
MINSEDPTQAPDESTVRKIVAGGPGGALALAAIATFVVVLIWVLFYLLVFVPRSS